MSAAIVLRFVRAVPASFTVRQLAVLTYLATADDLQTTRSIAKAIGVGKPIISRVCNTYPQYLHRRKDANDLRSVFVTLTKAGWEFVEEVAGAMAAAIEGER